MVLLVGRCPDIQTSYCKHQADHNFLPPGKRELDQFRQWQNHQPEVDGKVETSRRPGIGVNIDARSDRPGIVKAAPKEAYRSTLEGDGHCERDSRGHDDGYGDVNRCSKSGEANEREEAQVETQDR